jgi:hypothetical protein
LTSDLLATLCRSRSRHRTKAGAWTLATERTVATGLPLFDHPRAPAIAACESAAVSRGWDSDAATACILEELSHGDAPAERLVDRCKACGYVPHDDRAFGALFVKLSRAGKIVSVGFVKRRNGSPQNVWRLT